MEHENEYFSARGSNEIHILSKIEWNSRGFRLTRFDSWPSNLKLLPKCVFIFKIMILSYLPHQNQQI